MSGRTWCVVALGLAFAAQGLAGDNQAEAKRFQGTWQVVSLEKNGKSEAVPEGATMVFTGEKFLMKGGEADYGGIFTLDPLKRPRRIDTRVTQGENKVVQTQGIYEFAGDTLKIAWREGTDLRPMAFLSKLGSGVRLITLKRQR
ncbi:MAG: TIGR03067 domain-containing protein [Gemmataceae bacterium]|nr:TIGR03067 domain-containing protein [Gemmataceae bacterium]